MPTSTPPGHAPGNRPVTVIALGAVMLLGIVGVLMMRHRTATGGGQNDAQVCATLLQQTEAISLASQTGDAKVFERYFDPAIVFTNEEGTVAGKKDTVEGTTPATGPVTRVAKVTDWSCHASGDVAATSFVDEVTQPLGGQTLTFRYRSTEAWRRDVREGTEAGWLLLASETLTLSREPWAVSLPPAALDEYVGEYHAAADVSVKVERQGNDLVSATNGGAPLPLRAEAKDVFFVPGHLGTRKIFRRDDGGHVTGYVSRTAGGDLVLTRSG